MSADRRQIPDLQSRGTGVNGMICEAANIPLKAPFPAFGGKRRAAALVWERLGDVRNFIEPFCFSAAVLLSRPHPGRVETLNDVNAFVANFWRAVQRDPGAVAYWADAPVNECNLHSQHRWLVSSRKARAALARVKADPDYFNAKIAGWWCHGACCWIGSGWCHRPEWKGRGSALTGGHGSGRGVNAGLQRLNLPQKMPPADPKGRLVHSPPAVASQQIPRLPTDGDGGHGVLGRPQLADTYARGRGVNGHDAAGSCAGRRAWLEGWMARLADRLRPVRVCCGHWARVCDSHSTLTRLGTTGVFLDPPYRLSLADGGPNRGGGLYASDGTAAAADGLCDEVQAWCLKWGDDPAIRVALCGLDGEYPALDAAGWEKVAWHSMGGYGNRTARGRENVGRERIWFNKSCVRPAADPQLRMF